MFTMETLKAIKHGKQGSFFGNYRHANAETALRIREVGDTLRSTATPRVGRLQVHRLGLVGLFSRQSGMRGADEVSTDTPCDPASPLPCVDPEAGSQSPPSGGRCYSGAGVGGISEGKECQVQRTHPRSSRIRCSRIIMDGP